MTRLLLVEENLKSRRGHQFEFATCLAQAAKHACCELSVAAHINADEWVRREGIHPVLTHGRLSRVNPGFLGISRKLDFLTNNYFCYRDLLCLLRKSGPCDAVFFPTASHYHLFCIWLLLVLHPKLVKKAVVFFVQQCTCWPESEEQPVPEKIAGILRMQLLLLAPMVRSGRVVIATETSVARDEYEKLSGLPVQLWGHPIEASPSGAKPRPKGTTFSSFGFARHEKGSDILINAVDLCLQDPRFDKTRFVLQWGADFDMGNGSRQTVPPRLLSSKRVKIINDPLDHEAYTRMLAESSAVLLPYRKTSYYGRLSRVSIEAAATGIPLIVSPGTHAAQVAEHQGAGLIMEDLTSAALVDAMAQFLVDESTLSSRAGERAELARKQNSSANFLAQMLRSLDLVHSS
jgi:glycosyltransferase involved in cell wall biosynthesis